MLAILKDRTLAAKVSSTLQVQSIELVENLIVKGAFNGNLGVAQFIPALSSVCTKSLSHDYKSTAKVRQSLIRLWGLTLNKHVIKLKVVMLQYMNL